jgi:nucleoside-diphosphate-sugar epimerase
MRERHFITGGSGFFGLHLIDKLLAEGQDVTVYDLEPLDDSYQKKGVTYVKGDVRDYAAMRDAMRGSQVVHHNAAVLPVSRAGKHFMEINVGGTENAMRAAAENGVRKLVFLSTSSVYGIPKELPITEKTVLTPLGEYGFSKEKSEQALQRLRQESGLDATIIRPRTIIGTGRMGIFGILFDWIAAGKTIYIIGTGDNLFQFLSAPDLANACWLATQKPCAQEDFVIGAAEYGTVRGDMEALIAHAGTASRVRPTNAFLVRSVLGVVDWMKISPLVDWHYKTPHKPFYFDTAKAQTMLGWHAKDSNVSMLTDTYDWYMAHREELKATGTTHRKGVKQGVLRLLKMFS